VGGIEINVCFPAIAVALCLSTQSNVDTQLTVSFTRALRFDPDNSCLLRHSFIWFLYLATFKSNYKLYAYIVRHKYVLGGMLFDICKAQLHFHCTN
jgi:hypothetical protein